MLKIIISPAKKMNVRNDILSYKNIPFFINEAQTLFSYMKNMSLEELKNLWKCSDKLVQENEQQLRTGNLKQNLSPAILSIVIGIILFLFQLRLPQFIENPLEMIASMNTPLGMIVAGANLAQGNILKSLKNKRLYYLSFIKLIVYPLAGLVVLWLLPLEFEVAFTVFIALACPAGASVIMFAQRYDRDAYYASEIFVITTLLSAVTIPLLSVVAVSLLS